MQVRAHPIEIVAWTWEGGRPALDFVNTLTHHGRRATDLLAGPADLADWLLAAGVVHRAPSAVPVHVLEGARELRGAIDALVLAGIDGAPASAADVDVVDGWLRVAGSRPALALGRGGVPELGERSADHSPRRALGQIALDAAQMLADPRERERMRVCASSSCQTRFYDRSPGAARRWCSMKTCGNAAKVRAHRARVKARRSA